MNRNFITILCLFNQMILETSRLILRPFQDEDIGRLAELMANCDFMRFSLGSYTREQTQTVLQKFLSWNQARLPSQFAVIFSQQQRADRLLRFPSPASRRGT